MSSFKEGLHTEVKGINEIYKSSDIYIKEDHKTGESKAYSPDHGEKVNDKEYRCFLVNIEDSTDIISYRTLLLPKKLAKRINEQADECSLYTCSSVFYALFGEELSPFAILTIDKIKELISQYQDQKQEMKYVELQKARYGREETYIGKYLEEGRLKSKELFGSVLSRVDLQDINRIEPGERLARIDCLEKFEKQKNTLKFTERALQKIVDRERGKEKY